MAKRPLPTPEELRQLLRYEPETGKFFWLERTPEMFGNTDRPKKYAAQAWNAKNAGRETFVNCGTDGYLYGSIWRRSVAAHRVALAITDGEWPEHYVDHANGIKTDNRLENLRAVSPFESAMNMPVRSSNKSGKTGVDRLSSREPSPWRARIVDRGHPILLGWYRTKDEAVAAREAAEKVLGYHPNHGRPNPKSLTKPESLRVSTSSRPKRTVG